MLRKAVISNNLDQHLKNAHAKQYGGEAGADMTKFPDVKFAVPQVKHMNEDMLPFQLIRKVMLIILCVS